ncbi:hypothetical protein BST95_07695 [Halioglobus japonicus]|nr:hypothetical protein BST95_07695 [Halioglobus japonicus]
MRGQDRRQDRGQSVCKCCKSGKKYLRRRLFLHFETRPTQSLNIFKERFKRRVQGEDSNDLRDFFMCDRATASYRRNTLAHLRFRVCGLATIIRGRTSKIAISVASRYNYRKGMSLISGVKVSYHVEVRLPTLHVLKAALLSRSNRIFDVLSEQRVKITL